MSHGILKSNHNVPKVQISTTKSPIAQSMKSYLLGRYAQPTLCHAELVSASITKQTLKRVQGDRGKCCSLALRERVSEGRVRGRFGFTLAETLITIGIIGVVSALTIPNLIKEHQKRATVTKLQKGISIINQAYKLSFDEQGEPEDTLSIGAEAYFKQYWQPYIKMLQYCDTYQKCGYTEERPFIYSNNEKCDLLVVWPVGRTTFYTHDGLLYIIFVASGSLDHRDNRVFLDINGGEKPNKYGRDLFVLERIEDGGGVRPYGYEKSDININKNCSKTGTGEYCAEKIRRAGWKIEKDYPW